MHAVENTFQIYMLSSRDSIVHIVTSL